MRRRATAKQEHEAGVISALRIGEWANAARVSQATARHAAGNAEQPPAQPPSARWLMPAQAKPYYAKDAEGCRRMSNNNPLPRAAQQATRGMHTCEGHALPVAQAPHVIPHHLLVAEGRPAMHFTFLHERFKCPATRRAEERLPSDTGSRGRMRRGFTDAGRWLGACKPYTAGPQARRQERRNECIFQRKHR